MHFYVDGDFDASCCAGSYAPAIARNLPANATAIESAGRALSRVLPTSTLCRRVVVQGIRSHGQVPLADDDGRRCTLSGLLATASGDVDRSRRRAGSSSGRQVVHCRRPCIEATNSKLLAPGGEPSLPIGSRTDKPIRRGIRGRLGSRHRESACQAGSASAVVDHAKLLEPAVHLPDRKTILYADRSRRVEEPVHHVVLVRVLYLTLAISFCALAVQLIGDTGQHHSL